MDTNEKVRLWRNYFRIKNAVEQDAIRQIPVTKDEKVQILTALFRGWTVTVHDDGEVTTFTASRTRGGWLERLRRKIHNWWFGTPTARAFHFLTAVGSREFSHGVIRRGRRAGVPFLRAQPTAVPRSGRERRCSMRTALARRKDVIDDILAYIRSPRGQEDFALRRLRDGRTSPPPVTVPEDLVGQFTREYEVLAAKGSPWVQDSRGETSEEALIRTLVKARAVALLIGPLYLEAEKWRLSQKPNPTEADLTRLHQLRVLSVDHPSTMTLDIQMLVCDPRLDACGYQLAPWLTATVAEGLNKMAGREYGVPWVDAALAKAA